VAEHTCSKNESNDNIQWNKIFYSLLYFDLRLVFSVLKYLYSVISVIVDSLLVNTKMSAIDKFVDGQSAIFCIVGGCERMYEERWL